jgi:hypothetical protein
MRGVDDAGAVASAHQKTIYLNPNFFILELVVSVRSGLGERDVQQQWS